jgi:hypothetical protein
MEQFVEMHWLQQTTNPVSGSDTLATLSWFGDVAWKIAAIFSPSELHYN